MNAASTSVKPWRKSCTDLKRMDATKDEAIDVSEHPEMTPEMFAGLLPDTD